MDMKKIGENIKHIRKLKGMNQGELGEKAGLSQGAISLVERGDTISIESLFRIATALDVSMSTLFEDQVPKIEEDISQFVGLIKKMTPSERRVALALIEAYLQTKDI